MPFDGSGNYTLPPGYAATANTPVKVSQHNPPLEDIASALSNCIKKNGATAMTGALVLSGDPTLPLHASTKQFVEAKIAELIAAAGLKSPVVVATTANISLTGEQTIDGVLTAGSRVLVRAQTAPAENGIYVTGAGSWARASDMDTWAETPSAIVIVQQGTTLADTIWFCTSNTGGTLGTTAITWQQTGGAGAYQALDALLTSIAGLSVASGDLIYATGADAVAKLGIGSTGNLLRVVSGLPSWAASSALAATQTELEAGTSVDAYSTPGRQHFHPSAIKAWANTEMVGTHAIRASYNVASVTDEGVGLQRVNLTTAFSSTNYAATNSVRSDLSGLGVIDAQSTGTKTSTQFSIRTNAIGVGTFDCDEVGISFLGDQ